MNGTIGVLNVGAGDTKLTFDKNNPQECIRAARIVTDMLRRGYALLIDVGNGKYQRVKEFREDTCEYIIADFDSSQSQESDSEQTDAPEKTEKRGRKTRAVAADKTHGVAVARTAGG